MAGKMVRCKICGAEFEEGADTCPVCGVGKEFFEPIASAPAKARVRCKICGAEFEEGVDTCPVCGVGKEFFEPVGGVAAEEKSFGEALSIIIIGGGIAAVTAAQSARAVNKRAAVTIISAEDFLPYNRPMLTKDFAAAEQETPFPIYAKSFYEEQNIDLIRGKRVERIDYAANLLYCTDGSLYYFDRLVFATGAYCFVPPFKGADRANVIAIRGVEDARRIAAKLGEVQDIVVIGGGVLGLEAAWAMNRLGKQVTVLETADKLFAGKISAETSERLQEKIEAKGVRVLLSASTQEIKEEAVLLADGREIPAQIVLLSCGVRAEKSLAESIGVICNRGIVVDSSMRTNIAGVYACGDCASYQGINYALWEEAMLQAKVAGVNAAGDEKKYEQLKPAIIMQAFDTGMLVFGSTEREGCTSVVRESKAFLTVYTEGGKVCGVTSLGDITDMSRLMEWVNSGIALEQI